jgi:asparagine synthetase B (glutamine-hydrolysing)
VLPALHRPPCHVSFSGGRDSSVVLATALAAARRRGLDPPIPVTVRISNAPLAAESEWQERVIRHLGLGQWEVIELCDELDLVGPVATRMLDGHGLLQPFNVFFHVPILARAAGGSLLTGFGGDDLFAEWRWRKLADALAGRRRVTAGDLMDGLYLRLPRRARAGLDRLFSPRPPEWLRPAARSEVLRRSVAAGLDEPFAWERWVRWKARGRGLTSLLWGTGLLARDAGVEVVHPYLDEGFLSALGRLSGTLGLGDRTRLMRVLFGELLPAAVLGRPVKAWFGQVFWRRHSRELVRGWDGEGVDSELVSHTALRREWAKREPDARSFLLLQSVWLTHRTNAR